VTLLLVAIGVLGIALPGLRSRPLLSGDPRWFVRLAVPSVLVGMGCIFAGLAVSTTVAALHLALLTPSTPIDHLAPEGVIGGVAAGALLVSAVVRGAALAIRSSSMRATARVDSWLGDHRTGVDGVEVVVLPTQERVAYSVPGDPPQVVISEALHRSLDPEMLRFVVAHERAHLMARHRWILSLASVLESIVPVIPGARRTGLALRIAVERHADEEAAGTDVDHRTRAARAIPQAGLLPPHDVVPGLVQFRTDALTTPHRTPALVVAAAGLGVATVFTSGVASIVHASGDLSPYFAVIL
jgi:hypothetical protein